MSTKFRFEPPTRTKATEELYLQRYQSLRRRFSRESGTDNLTAEDVVARLLMIKDELCMSSWRQYRSAVLFVMDTRFTQFTVAIDTLRAETSEGLPKKSLKTSGQKLKQVPVLEREQF